MRVAINGFGRIGRTILRQLLSDPAHQDIAVVAINDIAPSKTCAYLFQYDSVYGPFPSPVTIHDETLHVANRVIPVLQTHDIGSVALQNVDVLLDCTGKTDTAAQAAHLLNTGARNLLISGPSEGAEATCVLGANQDAMGGARILSNASCTTNALAPLLALLHRAYGVRQGHSTTIHVYTGSQPMVDAPRSDSLARNRAGAVSMVPTTTSATGLVDRVLPTLAGRITGAAVRVPALSVSALDLTLQLDRPPKDLRADLKSLAKPPLFGWTEDPCVSSDFRGRPESLILALPEIFTQGSQARLFGWYDNEWGFSARMIDMARRMAAR